jgi:hypothetical protein
MKEMRARYTTPHMAESKNLANVSYEEVRMSIYHMYININVIIVIIYKFLKRFLCCEIL